MTFSCIVAQQREQQTANLKRFITYSLAGSLAFHGLGLLLKVTYPTLDGEEISSEEITIVATEPPSESLPEEPTFSSANPAEIAALPEGAEASGSEAMPAATVVETPVNPASRDEAVVEESIAEPEPQPSPVAEVPVDDSAVAEDTAEAAPGEWAETRAAAPAPSPRNLQDFLRDLRQAQQQGSQTSGTAAGPTSTSGSGRFGSGLLNRSGNGGVTTAVGPVGSGSGSNSGAGVPGGNGRGVNAAPSESRPSSGSRAREITCQDCDFDYPDEADGAEGQAQVIVETDEQGRVVSVTLSRSSGNAALDRAALRQARERVRLNNARAGESYPLEIDFVQPNSESARRVRERGDRRSVTVVDPEPAIAESPALSPNPSVQPERAASGETSPTPESLRPSPQPSSTSTPRREEPERPSEPAISTPTPVAPSAAENNAPSPPPTRTAPSPAARPATRPSPAARPTQPAAASEPAQPAPPVPSRNRPLSKPTRSVAPPSPVPATETTPEHSGASSEAL